MHKGAPIPMLSDSEASQTLKQIFGWMAGLKFLEQKKVHSFQGEANRKVMGIWGQISSRCLHFYYAKLQGWQEYWGGEH